MKTEVKMDLFGGGLFIPVRLWSKAERRYLPMDFLDI